MRSGVGDTTDPCVSISRTPYNPHVVRSLPIQPKVKASPWRFFVRAMRLRCPECGISPLFVPWRRTRSLHDWFTPLDGCPRCGYAYDREDGYFLMAIWGVHYFAIAGFGLVLGLILEHFLHIDVWWVVLLTALPTVVVGFLFARHAKSIYLAIDHFLDPHMKRP